jgi:hypothetical protein
LQVLLQKLEDYNLPNLSTTDVVMNTVVAPKVYSTRKATYDDCRDAIKGLGFKSMKDYNTWLESSNCQDIFYVYPQVSYRGKGWISTKHFLSLSDEEYKMLKQERGRQVGSQTGRINKTTKSTVKPVAKAKNQPSFTEVIQSLCKQGVPDHIVKVVFDSYNPSFQDLKELCQELIALRSK